MSSDVPWVTAGLTTVGTAVFGLLFALFYYQRSIIYPAGFPEGSRVSVPKPSEFRMPLYEDVEFVTDDHVRVRAYLIKQARSKECPTLLYFHANAGNMGHRLPIAQVFYERLRCNVFMLSYRGYGFSEGSPSETGIRLDVKAAMRFLWQHEQLDTTRFIVYGQSLGGAVAIDTVAQYPDAFVGLMVENTFTSLPKLVPYVMPYLKPFTMLVLDKWDSETSITKIKCPTLFLSGSRDELIPPSMMLRLYEQAGAPESQKYVTKFPDGTHNDTFMRPGYFDAIFSFYGRVFPTLHVPRL